MNIPILKSINTIQLIYSTGERPVLVDCDDLHGYICKYRRSTGSGYKLAGELIGSVFARLWEIQTPSIAFVEMQAMNQIASMNKRGNTGPQLGFGSQQILHAIDVTNISIKQLPVNLPNWQDLLKISIFDLWLCNEDRNSNNANLLYDVVENKLVAIDHGCIFNTADYGNRPSLLTSSDSILDSNLARYLLPELTGECSTSYQDWLTTQYSLLWEKIDNNGGGYVEKCSKVKNALLDLLPDEWGVDKEQVAYSLECIFERVVGTDCSNLI